MSAKKLDLGHIAENNLVDMTGEDIVRERPLNVPPIYKDDFYIVYDDGSCELTKEYRTELLNSIEAVLRPFPAVATNLNSLYSELPCRHLDFSNCDFSSVQSIDHMLHGSSIEELDLRGHNMHSLVSAKGFAAYCIKLKSAYLSGGHCYCDPPLN